MEPLFSIQIIQEKDILQFILQVLSPIAIIVASSVAASLANKQYRDSQKTKVRYLESLLETLKTYIEVSIESIVANNREMALKCLKDYNDYAEKIVQTLEAERLELASCTTYETLKETNYIGFHFWEAKELSSSGNLSNWEKDKERLVESYSLLLGSIDRALEHHK